MFKVHKRNKQNMTETTQNSFKFSSIKYKLKMGQDVLHIK